MVGGGSPETADAARRDQGRGRRDRRRVRLRPDRVPEPRAGHASATPTRSSATTDGRAAPGVEIRIVAEDGTDPASPATSARCASAARSCSRATSTRRSTPTPSTPTASSAPATSAASTTTATSSITGRLKDIIIRKGENISAKEVEDILYAHPKIADVAVVGLPDPERGELACAVVMLAPRRRRSDARRDRRPGAASEGLMTHEDPRTARDRRDSLPNNPAGKVLKDELRNRYA